MYYEKFIRTFDKSSLPNVSHDNKAQSYYKLWQKTAKRVELSNCRQISLLISGEYNIWIWVFSHSSDDSNDRCCDTDAAENVLKCIIDIK